MNEKTPAETVIREININNNNNNNNINNNNNNNNNNNYRIVKLNVIMDVLGGRSQDLEAEMKKVFGLRSLDILKRIKCSKSSQRDLVDINPRQSLFTQEGTLI